MSNFGSEAEVHIFWGGFEFENVLNNVFKGCVVFKVRLQTQHSQFFRASCNDKTTLLTFLSICDNSLPCQTTVYSTCKNKKPMSE